jgi:hypothetical protein
MTKMWEERKKIEQEKREQKEQMLRERKEKLEASRIRRGEQRKRHLVRTHRGQPLMKNAIDDLLSKIET